MSTFSWGFIQKGKPACIIGRKRIGRIYRIAMLLWIISPVIRDRMRYRFMMQLFGLKLDKKKWIRDFGCSVMQGLPAEYLFLKAAGAYERDDENCITLTRKGRYLMVAMMRIVFFVQKWYLKWSSIVLYRTIDGNKWKKKLTIHRS